MTVDAVRMSNTEGLMQLPNVVGVGIGEKQGVEVIKVLVSHKVPESALRPEEIIPKTLDGYEIDVEAIGFVIAQSG